MGKINQKMMAALLLSSLAMVGACGGPLPQVEDPPAQSGLLGHLQVRGQKMAIYSSRAAGPSGAKSAVAAVSERGPRFQVRDASGGVIGEWLTLDELNRRYPELARAYQSSMAQRAPVVLLAGE